MAKKTLRQEGRNVKGFDNTVSSPFARPVDDYQSQGNANDIKSDGLISLGEALAKGATGLAKFGADKEKKKQEEFMKTLEVYAEQVKNEGNAGLFNAIKAREQFPEFSVGTSMALAEMVGHNFGKEKATEFFSGLRNRPDVINDATKLKNEIANFKANNYFADGSKPFEETQFFSTGMMKAFDNTANTYLGQFEQIRAGNQRTEAGNFVTNTVVDAFSNTSSTEDAYKEIAKTFGEKGQGFTKSVTDSQSGTTGAVSLLDVTPLNPTEFNDKVVDAVTKLADEKDDLTLLDNIPQRYLNGANKIKIAEARERIVKDKEATYRTDLIRSEKRVSKFSTEQNDIVVKAMMSDKPGDLDVIRKKLINQDDKLFDKNGVEITKPDGVAEDDWKREVKEINAKTRAFLLNAKEAELNFTPGESKRNAANLTNDIRRGYTTGDWSGVFPNKVKDDADFEPTDDDIYALIQNSTKLHSKEKETLLGNADKLVGGYSVVNNTADKAFFKGRMENTIKSFVDNPTNTAVLNKLQQSGIVIEDTVRTTYHNALADLTEAWYSDPENSGKTLQGNELLKLRKEALIEAKEEFTLVTQMGNPTGNIKENQGVFTDNKGTPDTSDDTVVFNRDISYGSMQYGTDDNGNVNAVYRYEGTTVGDQTDQSKYVNITESPEGKKLIAEQQEKKKEKPEESVVQEPVTDEPYNIETVEVDPEYDVLYARDGVEPRPASQYRRSEKLFNEIVEQYARTQDLELYQRRMKKFDDAVQQAKARANWEAENKTKPEDNNNDAQIQGLQTALDKLPLTATKARSILQEKINNLSKE